MLINKIESDLKYSMKNKETIKILALRLLKTKISNFQKIDGSFPKDKDILKIVEKSINEVRQTIGYTTNDVKLKELNEELNVYQAIYDDFAPKKISEEDLKIIISDLKQNGFNIGQIMSYLKKNHEGLYDGKLASQLAK
jgi:uncharacterized protein